MLFAIDRAGLVGADGPTHAGSFDLSYLRCIPNILLMAPADEDECWRMLTTGFQHNGPAAVRYPRGCGPGVSLSNSMESLPVGKAELRRTGQKVCLLAFGSLLSAALEAAEALDATVVNMRFIKPLDENLLTQLAAQYSLFVTLEENALAGGAGSAVNEFLQREALAIAILNLGLPDTFITHGDTQHLLARCDLDANGIVRSVRDRLSVLKIN